MILWRRLRLTHKAGLLVAGMLVISSATVTLLTVRTFRRELIQQEHHATFTVYVAAANYLVGHYKSRGDAFVPAALDFVLGEKFLMMGEGDAERITHRPSQLLLYDADGGLLYAYHENGADTAPPPWMGAPPTGYHDAYDPEAGIIEIVGPVSAQGDIPGFVMMRFPTDAARKIAGLQRRAWTITGLFVLLAVGLAYGLTRRAVRPIEALTRAARNVSAGSLERCPEQEAEGELGMLVETFNDMVDSLTAKTRELVELNRSLEAKVSARTHELQSANEELKAFAYTVSHDLRAPLRGIAFACDQLDNPDPDDEAGDPHARIRRNLGRMDDMIEGILMLSRAQREELVMQAVDMSVIAAGLGESLREGDPERNPELVIAPGLTARGDRKFLSILLQNLLGNAWKFTRDVINAKIEFGVQRNDGTDVFFVRDNGAGFDMANAERLFEPFKRLHSAKEFPGTGVGLATAYRIVDRHGGTIRAESEPGKGATFFFTLEGRQD